MLVKLNAVGAFKVYYQVSFDDSNLQKPHCTVPIALWPQCTGPKGVYTGPKGVYTGPKRPQGRMGCGGGLK